LRRQGPADAARAAPLRVWVTRPVALGLHGVRTVRRAACRTRVGALCVCAICTMWIRILAHHG